MIGEFYCRICHTIIYPKNGYYKKEHSITNDNIGVLVKMHQRHVHSDYDEQVRLGYSYYLSKGFPPIIASRKAKVDAREKFEYDWKKRWG